MLEKLAEKRACSYPLPVLYESAEIMVACVMDGDSPSIVLPSEWRQWGTWKLQAVLAHELTHFQRRDSLVTLLAAVNTCVFWFHPLAWWLKKRLSTLAEHACDEGSVLVTGDPLRYAELLLDVASVLPAKGRRFNYGLSMASQSKVSGQVDRILDLARVTSGVCRNRAWVAMTACMLPLVCVMASAQMGPARPKVTPSLRGPGRGRGFRFRRRKPKRWSERLQGEGAISRHPANSSRTITTARRRTRRRRISNG